MTVETGLARQMRPSVVSGHSPRFNPFNDDMSISSELDDDTLAPSSASEITSTTSEGSGDISLAELGLTEDYFAQPAGLFGMSSVEELEAAIENCKTMIIEARQHSERQKKLVNKLIQLRMKLQELKEGPAENEPKLKQVLQHKLRRKKSNSVKYYCDCCNGLIWGMMQAWYRCKECGFNCHFKCVNLIRRKCIATDLKNRPYILNITPESGLSAQQFNCTECKNPISVTGMGKEEARLCDYSGQYYCPQCHWNDTSVIPARVLHNWDFTQEKISRQSYQILSRLYRKPLLNIQEVNHLLFNYVEELADIRKLREDILLMKEYFITCNSALELKLLLKLTDRQHFVDGSHMYSMEDLIQAQDGTLTHDLTTLHAEYAKHIKLDCMCCQAKGFICEICNSGETLFPFDFGVATCTKCKAVFHRDCFTCIDCPRCERLRKKKDRKTASQKVTSESEENVSETEYLQYQNSSSDSDSRKNDIEKHRKKSKNGAEYVPAFSTDPTYTNSAENNVPKTRGRTASSSIKIENTSKKMHDTSLHALLTESSYTDYAVLGFTGAGKGKSSLPSNGPTASNEVRGRDLGPSSQKIAKKPMVVSEITTGGYRHRPESNFHSNTRKPFSRVQIADYESNPITRRRQRDDTSFSDLVRVKGHSKIKVVNGRRKSPSEELQKSRLIGPNGTTKVKSRTSQGKLTSRQLSDLDPFHVNKSKGSKFINDLTTKKKPVSGQTFDRNLDPFNQNETKDSWFNNDAAKVKSRSQNINGNNDNPELHPSYRNGGRVNSPSTNVKSRSTNAGIDGSSAKVKSRSSHRQNAHSESYNPELNPFGHSIDQRSKLTNEVQSSSHGPADFSNGGNPFESDDSGNPFNYYDESKNPFSID